MSLSRGFIVSSMNRLYPRCWIIWNYDEPVMGHTASYISQQSIRRLLKYFTLDRSGEATDRQADPAIPKATLLALLKTED